MDVQRSISCPESREKWQGPCLKYQSIMASRQGIKRAVWPLGELVSTSINSQHRPRYLHSSSITKMPSNRAAWLTAAESKPLQIGPAPYTPPGEHEIVIKNAAVGVNHIDCKLQDFALYPLNYPAVLGHGVAGEVFEVGSAVTRFQKGERVLGHAISMKTKRASDGAFQEYTVVRANMASQFPSSMPFERAAVVPLALSTAVVGLYQKGNLELQYPTLNPKPTGKVLLVWGGATSVGCNAIQLAVSSGYEVYTTSSPKNFNYMKKLGASQAFDHNAETIVGDLIRTLKGKTIAGALDCWSIDGGIEKVVNVVKQSEGNQLVCHTTRLTGPPPTDVRIKWFFGIIDEEVVSKAVYEDFLPRAIAEGKFDAAPEPLIVGKGLESVQAGLDMTKKGLSAKKAVITL